MLWGWCPVPGGPHNMSHNIIIIIIIILLSRVGLWCCGAGVLSPGAHTTCHTILLLLLYCCLELGCDVVGLVSSPRGPTQHVTQYYTGGELSGMMSGLDYLINVLPATQETNNLLTRYIIRYIDRGFKQILEKTSNIARMSASSMLVVGTSSVRRTFCLLLTTTSSAEPSLTSLIWSHFLKIPLCGLTKTSWVWTIWLNLFQVFVSVTPHVAGESRAEDVAECFIQNLHEDLDGRDPRSLVDWSKLY